MIQYHKDLYDLVDGKSTPRIFDPIKVLGSRSQKRLSGYSYKLDNAQFALDYVITSGFTFDQSKMSMTIPFADGHRRDGVGDLLEIGGIDLSRHQQNAIVLFDHGKQVTLPIAMSYEWDDEKSCYDKDRYTVDLDLVNKQAVGEAFFYQGKGIKSLSIDDAGKEYDHALFCEQLYDMSVKGLLRGGSIGYQVKQGNELPPDYHSGVPGGVHLLQVMMLEYSLVVLPANADTVVKVLSPGTRICGKRPSPYLVKSFAPYAPAKKSSASVPLRKLPDTKIPPPKWKPGAGAVKAMLSIGNEYEVVDSSGKVIGTIYVLGNDNVQIYVNEKLVKITTIDKATQAAKEKGHKFRKWKSLDGKKGFVGAVKKVKAFSFQTALAMADKESWTVLEDYLVECLIEHDSKIPDSTARLNAKKQVREMQTYAEPAKVLRRFERSVKGFVGDLNWLKEEEKEAEHKGYKARMGLKACNKNPYPEDAKAYDNWTKGWQDADREVKRQGQKCFEMGYCACLMGEKEPIDPMADALMIAWDNGWETAQQDLNGVKSLRAQYKAPKFSNVTGFQEGDTVFAREILHRPGSGPRGRLELFAKAGERLKVYTVHENRLIVVINPKTGDMGQFSSAQLRKGKSMQTKAKESSARRNWESPTAMARHAERALKEAGITDLWCQGAVLVFSADEGYEKQVKKAEGVLRAAGWTFRVDDNKITHLKKGKSLPPKAKVEERESVLIQNVKSLTPLRKKYRPIKGLRRRVRSSKAGSSVIHIHGKDLEAVKSKCSERGLELKWLGTKGTLEKLRLTGDDKAIDEVAGEWGRRVRR